MTVLTIQYSSALYTSDKKLDDHYDQISSGKIKEIFSGHDMMALKGPKQKKCKINMSFWSTLYSCLCSALHYYSHCLVLAALLLQVNEAK